MLEKIARLRKTHLILFFLLMVSGCLLFSQDKAAKIDELMRTYSEYGNFNGSILIAENGKVILKKGYGMANMEWNIKNEPDTKFRLGSITKQFTSMLIMQLVEAGKIKLEDKIIKLLPDYRKDIGDKVTIHHLLTHTSGIPGYTELPDFFEKVSREFYKAGDFIKKYCSNDLKFEPGSKWEYSNSGYFILGAIIEKITGETYEDVLKEKIFRPLKMETSGYDHYSTIINKRASGYEKSASGYVNAAYLDMSIPYSAGSLFSTVEDLYLWDQALYGENLLGQKYKDLMFKPQVPAFGGNYAYGWVITQQNIGNEKKTIISHGGGINGFNTLICRIIDDKNLIVLLNNTGGTFLEIMAHMITNILYDKPYNLPKKPVSAVILKVIEEEGIESAIKKYNDLKSLHKNDYDFGENQLNTAGYRLLSQKKNREAIEIFKLNIENFPNSSNLYDSLGEAYMINGDKELAIKNYEKSVELNPKNTNGIKALKNLNEK
jgi:CubicO group peptidase (beta-lactamase class C family)